MVSAKLKRICAQRRLMAGRIRCFAGYEQERNSRRRRDVPYFEEERAGLFVMFANRLAPESKDDFLNTRHLWRRKKDSPPKEGILGGLSGVIVVVLFVFCVSMLIVGIFFVRWVVRSSER